MTASATRPITDQEFAFVRALLEGMSQAEAARRAGYSGTDASMATRGSALMKQPRVKAELARQRAILDAKSNMTREARLAWLEAQILDPRLEPRDRLKALELRGKMAGDFLERRQIENTGPAGGPVKVEITFAGNAEAALEALARKGLDNAPGTAAQASTAPANNGGAAPTTESGALADSAVGERKPSGG